jgi:branched-chain amino acid aminotransferase
VATQLAFRDGEILPYAEVTVGIGTHALHYGTNVFEGLRAYWNAAAGELFIFRAHDHYDRLRTSARFYGMPLPYSTADLCAITAELLAQSDVKEDAYIRPILFTSSDGIGLWRRGLETTFVIFHVPMGKYIGESGIRCCVSPWRRPHGNAAPTRAKIGGVYASLALARRDAMEGGFDEAITLTFDGRVAEGSAENIFLVIDGRLVTPSLGSDILAGITRASIIELARTELALHAVERDVNLSELSFAHEVFLCGTAAEVTPVTEIDRRPVGEGRVGPVTQALADIYGQAVRCARRGYERWCQPVYGTAGEWEAGRADPRSTPAEAQA